MVNPKNKLWKLKQRNVREMLKQLNDSWSRGEIHVLGKPKSVKDERD